MRQVFLLVQMAAIVVVAYIGLEGVSVSLNRTDQGRQTRRQLTVEVPIN